MPRAASEVLEKWRNKELLRSPNEFKKNTLEKRKSKRNRNPHCASNKGRTAYFVERQAKMIQSTATIEFDGEVLHFASLDGEHFVGLSRAAEPEDAARIKTLIEGDGQSLPMLVTRRFLEHHSAKICDWTARTAASEA